MRKIAIYIIIINLLCGISTSVSALGEKGISTSVYALGESGTSESANALRESGKTTSANAMSESVVIKNSADLLKFLNDSYDKNENEFILLSGASYFINASELTDVSNRNFYGSLNGNGGKITVNCDVPCPSLFNILAGKVHDLTVQFNGEVLGSPLAKNIENSHISGVNVFIDGDILSDSDSGAPSTANGFANVIKKSTIENVTINVKNIGTVQNNAYIATGFYGDNTDDASGMENAISNIDIYVWGGIYGKNTAAGFGRYISGWFRDIKITIGGDISAQNVDRVEFASGFAAYLKGSNDNDYFIENCQVRVGGDVKILVPSGSTDTNENYGGFLSGVANNNTRIINSYVVIGGSFDIQTKSKRTIYVGGFISTGMYVKNSVIENCHVVIEGNFYVENTLNIHMAGFFDDIRQNSLIRNCSVTVNENMSAESVKGYSHLLGFVGYSISTNTFKQNLVNIKGDVICNAPNWFAFVSGFSEMQIGTGANFDLNTVKIKSITAVGGMIATINGFSFNHRGNNTDTHIEITGKVTAIGDESANVYGFGETIIGDVQNASVKIGGMTATSSAGDAKAVGFAGYLHENAALDHCSVLVGGNIASIANEQNGAVVCGFVYQSYNASQIAYCFTKVMGDVSFAGNSDRSSASGFGFDVYGLIQKSSCYVKGYIDGGNRFAQITHDGAKVTECTMISDKRSNAFSRFGYSKAFVSENNFFTLIDGNIRDVMTLGFNDLGYVEIGEHLGNYIASNNLNGDNTFELYGSESGKHVIVDNAIISKGPKLSSHPLVALAATVNGKTVTLDIIELGATELEPGPTPSQQEHKAYLVGYPDNTVRLGKFLTGAEMAQILYRLSNEYNQTQVNFFSDINKQAWYYDAVKWIEEAGLHNGYPVSSFQPNHPITRAEYADMITRFLTLSANAINPYSNKTNDYYAYIDSFEPNSAITRAEALVSINHELNRKLKNGDVPDGVRKFVDVTPSDILYAQVAEAANDHSYQRGSDGFEIWDKIKNLFDVF